MTRHGAHVSVPISVQEEWDANGWFPVFNTKPGGGFPTLPYTYPHPYHYPLTGPHRPRRIYMINTTQD